MAVRTITRENKNNRVVNVWPKGVEKADVKVNAAGNEYALLDGAPVQPVTIDAHAFKAAFGFVPESGSKGRYIMRKAKAPQSLEDRLASAVRGLVREELGS